MYPMRVRMKIAFDRNAKTSIVCIPDRWNFPKCGMKWLHIMKSIIGMRIIQDRKLIIFFLHLRRRLPIHRPGARKVVDLNGDGAITKDDLYYAGDMAPRLTFGF